jgi:hypothetical protein
MAAEPTTQRRRGLGRVPRRLAVALGIVVALLVILRLVLDPIAAHYTRKALASGEGFRGAFADVHVSVLPPGFSIARLKIIEHPKGRWEDPIYYVERARISILWRELLRGHLVANAWIDRPKILVISRQEERTARKAKTIGEQLEEKFPLRIDRIDIDRGEVLLARGTGDEAPELWIHRADLVAENMATRKALMEGEHAKLRGSARVQRSGKLSLAFNMDPWAKGLTFSGKARLEDLALRELYAFTRNRADLQAKQGTIDLYVDVRARNGRIDGGVKPVLKNVEVEAARKDLGTRLEAALADAAIDLAENEDQGDDRVATVIPIRGTVSDAHAQLVPTILGVVRNAFVVGLSAGFSGIPPREASKKEGVLEQTWEALKKGEGPPEAQPEPRQGRRPR